MIVTDKSPVKFGDALPESIDYLIIGGGIIGVSTAYFLAKQNKKVLLCEKGRIAGEQSSRNWGWVRQQGRDASEMSIMKESLQIWKGLEDELGEDLGFKQGGCIYLADTEEKLAGYVRWKEDVATQFQLDTRVLTKSQTNLLVNIPDGKWAGAICTPSDGRAEPFIAAPKIAKAAQKNGAMIIENCAVRTLERTAGKITHAVTEKGTVSVGNVVCAAGYWSSLFMGNMGVRLPQLGVQATVARTKPVDSFFEGCAASDEISFRRRQDGGYTVTLSDKVVHSIVPDSFRYFTKFLPVLKNAHKDTWLALNRDFVKEIGKRNRWNGSDVTVFEKNRVLNPMASKRALKELQKKLHDLVPAFANVEFEESWAGMIETSPDTLPIIDHMDQDPNVLIVTGLSGHGFGIGPGIGRVVADLMQDKPPGHDLSPFKLSRFYNGAAIIPAGSI